MWQLFRSSLNTLRDIFAHPVLQCDKLKSIPFTLAEFRHNRIVQSPHENYFNVCRQHKEK